LKLVAVEVKHIEVVEKYKVLNDFIKVET